MKKMIKKISTVLAVCMLGAFMLTGCGDDASEDDNIDLMSVVDEMKATDSALPEMSTASDSNEDGEAKFAVLCDFDYSKVDKFVYSYSETGSPEEIALVHVVDKASVGDLMKALQAHIDSRLGTFRQYSPEKASVVEGAVLTYSGKYVLLAITPTSGAMQDVFKSKIG